MKAVIQRVRSASATVDGKVVASIDRGLLTLLGVMRTDTEAQLAKIIPKICELRIFADQDGKMNLSLKDVGGAHLIVSQFTLAGDCSSGKRPSFIQAARPEVAKPLFEKALALSNAQGVPTQGGVFQADMQVTLVNDGPVTLLLDID